MHYPNLEVKKTSQQAKSGPSEPRPDRVGLFQCLIVSIDSMRRDLLRTAASEGGWRTVLCADVDGAIKVAARSSLQLTILDLESTDGRFPPRFDEFQEWLTAHHDALSIVCGNEGNIQEEIWARQLGIWLYLAGDLEVGGLAAICDEARQITDRSIEAEL